MSFIAQNLNLPPTVIDNWMPHIDIICKAMGHSIMSPTIIIPIPTSAIDEQTVEPIQVEPEAAEDAPIETELSYDFSLWTMPKGVADVAHAYHTRQHSTTGPDIVSPAEFEKLSGAEKKKIRKGTAVGKRGINCCRVVFGAACYLSYENTGNLFLNLSFVLLLNKQKSVDFSDSLAKIEDSSCLVVG